jgi:hypothetical protein
MKKRAPSSKANPQLPSQNKQPWSCRRSHRRSRRRSRGCGGRRHCRDDDGQPCRARQIAGVVGDEVHGTIRCGCSEGEGRRVEAIKVLARLAVGAPAPRKAAPGPKTTNSEKTCVGEEICACGGRESPGQKGRLQAQVELPRSHYPFGTHSAAEGGSARRPRRGRPTRDALQDTL